MDNSLDKYIIHVEGENRGNIVMFTLSNCAWCRRAKQLLDELGVEYYYVDVDLAERKGRQKLMKTLERWNPACIFPTVVIDKNVCIGGYYESKIRKALEKRNAIVIGEY